MHVRYVAVFLAFTLLCLLNQSACLCIINYFSYRIKNNFSLKLRSKHSYYFSQLFTKCIAHLFCTKIMQQSIQCSLFKTFLNSIFERKISFEIQKSVKYFYITQTRKHASFHSAFLPTLFTFLPLFSL